MLILHALTYIGSDELDLLCAACTCPTGCLSMHNLYGLTQNLQQILHCGWLAMLQDAVCVLVLKGYALLTGCSSIGLVCRTE